MKLIRNSSVLIALAFFANVASASDSVITSELSVQPNVAYDISCQTESNGRYFTSGGIDDFNARQQTVNECVNNGEIPQQCEQNVHCSDEAGLPYPYYPEPAPYNPYPGYPGYPGQPPYYNPPHYNPPHYEPPHYNPGPPHYVPGPPHYNNPPYNPGPPHGGGGNPGGQPHGNPGPGHGGPGPHHLDEE